MMWLASGTTPNARHDSNTGTVTITSSVSITNDTAWHTIVTAWRKNRLELYVDDISRASSTAANTATSDAFGIYRWGWGFSTNQDFNGDIALILCCGACWTGHMVRRWHADPFGFLRPWNEVPALIASAPPATPPFDRHRRGDLPDGVRANVRCRLEAAAVDGLPKSTTPRPPPRGLAFC